MKPRETNYYRRKSSRRASCSADFQQITKMAKFNSRERELLAEICHNYPILADMGYSLDIINQKKEAWTRIQSEFNSMNPGKPARDVVQLKGLWKRMKLKTKADLDAQRRDAGRTGGGPPTPPLGRPEQVVSQMFGGQFDPLPDTMDDDAGPFQEGPEVVVDLVPERTPQKETPSCETPRRSSKRKICDQTVQEELLEMARREHMKKMRILAKEERNARIEHAKRMKILSQQERNEDLRHLLLLHECTVKNVQL